MIFASLCRRPTCIKKNVKSNQSSNSILNLKCRRINKIIILWHAFDVIIRTNNTPASNAGIQINIHFWLAERFEIKCRINCLFLKPGTHDATCVILIAAWNVERKRCLWTGHLDVPERCCFVFATQQTHIMVRYWPVDTKAIWNDPTHHSHHHRRNNRVEDYLLQYLVKYRHS